MINQDKIFAKKSLGQNFLISPAPIRLMIKEAKISGGDTVLEIGPGKGILTEALLATGAKVIAVEKDDELIPYLQEKFSEEIKNGKLNLVHGDVLNLTPESLQLSASNYKLIANIPYYITGEIVRKFLEADCGPSCMAILVQKEVAERIAKDKKGSILSISVKAYGDPRYLGTVKRGLFRPMPNVDSAVLLIENISKKFFEGIDEKKFFEILKTGFAHKRKKLIKNLELITDKDKLKFAFSKLALGENTRAEELSLGKWQELIKEL